jgi:hypothetical protein
MLLPSSGIGGFLARPDWQRKRFLPGRRRDRAFWLHPSGASEADRDLPVLDDHGNLSAAGDGDHPLELLLVGLDVDVDEGNLALCVVLTGRGRVGSGVFAENLHAVFCHGRPPREAVYDADAMIFDQF